MKSAATVGGVTLISRIMGFIRDVVIAHTFGAGASTDAFLVAFKIPNFMRRLFAEGAFSQAFVPVLSEYKTQREAQEVKHLVDRVAGTMASVLFVVTLLGLLLAPILVLIFAPGFTQHGDKYQLTIDLLRITFPYLLFVALTAFAGSILNTFGYFSIPAFTPVLLNICLIVAATIFAPYFEEPITALAWGVFVAGIVQLLFQLPFLRRLGMLPRPRIDWQDAGVKKVYTLMLPALLGVSVTQINLLVDTLMASFLVTGSVSWLYYSDRLMEFPVGVFGLALATVILPSLSKTVALKEMVLFNATLDWALRWVFVVTLPAMLGLILLAIPMLATLFNYGQFSQQDVTMTSYSLMAYAVGLPAFVLIKVLASGFYSRQDTRTPVRIAIIAMVANMTLNLLFIIPLQHTGLALATSLAALLNAALLYFGLRKNNTFTPLSHWPRLLLQVSVACAVMGGVLWWGAGEAPFWFNASIFERVTGLFLWIFLGMAIYGASLFLVGFRLEQMELRSPVRE
jgi:putative peptidoglycan lipid II flippase